MSFVWPLHLPWIPARNRGTGRAVAGETKWGRRVDLGGGIAVGVLLRDVSAWIPAFAGMTNSEGPELWLSTANWHGGLVPHPKLGTSPRLAKSSTALHFLIPPSAIGLQFGTFRPASPAG